MSSRSSRPARWTDIQHIGERENGAHTSLRICGSWNSETDSISQSVWGSVRATVRFEPVPNAGFGDEVQRSTWDRFKLATDVSHMYA